MRYIIWLLLTSFFYRSSAQPYLDLANIRYAKSPGAGIVRRDKQPADFDYLNINLNIPWLFKKDSSVLLFSPFVEQWYLRLNNVPYLPGHFQSAAFQVSFIKSINKKWAMTIGLIPRWNGYTDKWFDHNFQIGAALIATYIRDRKLKYKFGLYYNRELSGPFIIPLIGIDWKIDEKNNISGVLPGNMLFEHKAVNWFFYGLIFKAITNSYRAGQLNNKSYFMRIDDNQLTAYADIYLAKKIVFTMEAGHSVLRRFRLGFNDGPGKYFYTDKINDDWVIKASFAYRLRF